MKTNVIISIRDVINIKDKKLIYSFLAVLFGLLSGVIIYAMSGSVGDDIFELLLQLNTDFSDKNKTEIISGIILSGLPYFAVMFILGGSVFGKSLCIFTTIIKAMGISALTSYFYTQLGLKGLEYTLLVFFPGKVIILLGMLFLTRNCIEMSEAIITTAKVSRMKEYCIKSFAALLIFVFSWLIDFLCILVFSDLFSF